MTKATMPEPAVWIKTRRSNGEVELCMDGPVKHSGLFDWQPLINTDQAEAYAYAKVREALEEAAEIADRYKAFATYDAIRARIPKEPT